MKKKNFMWLRKLHGKFHERQLKKTQEYFDKHISEIGTKESLFLAKQLGTSNDVYPIDFVVSWVDSSDKEWLLEKERYSENKKDSTNEARYRNWDLFRYWFRSVEQYAPWVRHVYLITWGHIPKWLNTESEKLIIVNHSEYIPQQYLPTFSSRTIELNIHRIKGLSEHFVLFNDDMMLNQPCKPSDFFCNGLPKYPLIALPNYPFENMGYYEYSRYTNAGVINSHFNLKESIRMNLDKWFSYLYTNQEKELNKRVYEDGKILGLYMAHLSMPLKKSVFEEVWKTIPNILDRTCSHKFRNGSDVNIHLLIGWALCKGEFYPVSKDYYGVARNITIKNFPLIKKCINEGSISVCFNDSESISKENFLLLKDKMNDILSSKFPEKSQYEK